MKFFQFGKLKYEFAKTPEGVRAGFYAIFPLILCIFFVIAFFASQGSDMDSFGHYLLLNNACISLVGTCITQLQYQKLLNDYILSNKK